MPHRVIECTLSCASLLATLQHQVLRHIEHGVIAAVPDEAMRVVLERQPEVPILYFSRAAWDSATNGLTKTELDEMLQNRRDRWSPNAPGFALDWIAQHQRRLLALTAHGLHRASASDRAALTAHFDNALALLSDMAGQGRYDDMEWIELLEVAQQKDVLLMAELPKGNEQTLRTSYADEFSTEFAARGRADLAEALPFTNPQRGAWIAPFDQSVRTWLSLRGLARVSWKDGVVATVPLSDIRQFREEGKQAVILYTDPGELMQDMSDLTRTQLRRRFESLSTADETERARQAENYLNGLRLDVAQLRRTMLLLATKDEPRLEKTLTGQVESETRLLADRLAHSQTWMPQGITSVVAALRRGEHDIALEIRFFINLSRARGDKDLESRLSTILETKASDIARVAKLKD